MDIDIYQPCPCQSGKKIKFCCAKDLVPDLNQVLSLHKGKQHVAALEKLDRLLDKKGDRACLSALKTHVLIHMKEYQQAWDVNEQFQSQYPTNPLGFQHAALLHAAKGQTASAVDALQNGVEACGKDEVPITMANAFRTVGMLLMSQGFVVAGRAHLIYASEIRNGEDELVGQLILQSFSAAEIPLLLKGEFPFQVDEELQTPWADKLRNASRFSSRGRWRSARILAEKLNDQHPNVPEIVKAIATWSLFLADHERAIEAFRNYSELDGVDHDVAVEARATSFVIDPEPVSGSLDVVRVTLEIRDLEKLTEQAVVNPQLMTGSLLSHHFIDPDGPPPQTGYLLLNAPEVKSSEDVTDDQYPQVIGESLIWGRTTDREAVVQYFGVRDGKFDENLKIFRDQFNDCLGDVVETETVEEIPALDHHLSFKWHLPADMTLPQRQDFVQRQREREYLEIWPTIAFRPLDNQSPNDVASDPARKLDVEALVLMLEQGADSQAADTFDFNKLRDHLGLPVPQPVDSKQVDMDQVSPIQTQRVDFAQLTDQELIKTYVLASSCGNIRVLRLSGPEILKRPDMEKFIRFEMVYVMLARLNADTDAALEMMAQARQHAMTAGRPVGNLLVDELEVRLERNRPEGCQELLRVLQTSHMNDPRIQYRLTSVLQKFGIIGPDGAMRRDPRESAEAVAGPASGNELWTPDSEDGGAPSVPGESGQSKLWLPD